MKNKLSDLQGSIEPTRSELEILQVLWKHGPSTVRFVNDHLKEEVRPVQYTSTLKLMQIMVDKKILTRDESNMKHVYSPVLEERATKGMLVERMAESIFGGSKSEMIMQLLGNSKPSEKELKRIKDLLKELDKK